MAGKDPLHEEQLDQEAEARGELQERLQTEQDEEWKGMEDWTTERENEIQRLEQENAMLRNAIGISIEQERELGLEHVEITTLPSPLADRLSSSRSSSLRDDRGRGSGRLTIGPLNSVVSQRRSGPPSCLRRNYTERTVITERIGSPPNDWGPLESWGGPVVESI